MAAETEARRVTWLASISVGSTAGTKARPTDLQNNILSILTFYYWKMIFFLDLSFSRNHFAHESPDAATSVNHSKKEVRYLQSQ